MRHARILDVTLRDGGYRNNFNFTKSYAAHVVKSLAETGVEYVEIGYCNGSFSKRPEHGLTSRVDESYISALKEAAGKATKLGVMVHPHNVTSRDLSQLSSLGISLIRVCLRPDQIERGLTTISIAKEAGMAVSSNITRATELARSRVIRMATLSEQAGADIICVADSNGAMIPDEVGRLFADLSGAVATPLGFHAHNNLSLALSNAIAANCAGAEYIDTAINGMGKGAGNLHLAMFIAYLDRVSQNHSYDFVRALKLSSTAAREVPENAQPHPLVDVMMGAYNLSADVLAQASASQCATNPFEALKEVYQQREIERRAGVGRAPVSLANTRQDMRAGVEIATFSKL